MEQNQLRKRRFKKEFSGPEKNRTWEMVRQFLKQHHFSDNLREETIDMGRKIPLYHAPGITIAELGIKPSGENPAYIIRVYYSAEKELPFVTKAN